MAEKDTLLRLTETQYQICSQEKLVYQQQIQAYQQIINSQQEITANVSAVSTQKDSEIKYLQKEIAKQKVKTWFAILGGVVSTAFVSYLWISK